MVKNPTDSLPLLLKESGSTSRAVNPSSSISERLIVVTLPQELITEILVRLPVKSLVKFKCVSKPWLSLISNQQFIRSHLSKSTSIAEAGDLNLELLFATKDGMKKCCLSSAFNSNEADPPVHISALEFPAHKTHSNLFKTKKITYSIVGIINGLVCINFEGNDELCVWNPSLNKIKYFNAYPQAASGLVNCFFSFGYEESNDDYKVVSLQPVHGNDIVEDFYNVCIYSLKADSWKRIDELKGFFLPTPGVFANGKIYWPGNLLAPPNLNIVSLDMSSEKFVELQPPEYEYDAGGCLLRMGVSGGQPFVLCVYTQVMKVELWVLDKCGVEECWCKLVSFPNAELGHNVLVYNYRVLWISSNGEIVLGDKHGLIVYNYKKKESRSIKLAVGITTPLEIAAYVESLVWRDYA